MPESTVVVNICSQRTGSKFFGSCLRAGADIVPLGEVFNPDAGQAFTFWSWLAVNGKNEFGNGISVRVLDRFFEALYTQFGPFYFDLMYNQMSAVTPSWTDGFGIFVLEYFKRKKFHVIHTERNPADIFVSLKKLSLTGVAHARAGQSLVEAKNIDISLYSAEFRDFRKNYYAWVGAVNQEFGDYDRFFNLSFDRLTSAGGRLPDDLVSFLSAAVRCSGPEYGDYVQVRDSVFGKAPRIVTEDASPLQAAVQKTALVVPLQESLAAEPEQTVVSVVGIEAEADVAEVAAEAEEASALAVENEAEPELGVLIEPESLAAEPEQTVGSVVGVEAEAEVPAPVCFVEPELGKTEIDLADKGNMA